MLGLLASLLLYYSLVIATLFLSTVILIVSGHNWGRLSHVYIGVISRAQRWADARLEREGEGSENNNNPVDTSVTLAGKTHLCEEVPLLPITGLLPLSADLLRSGVECIVQDDVSRGVKQFAWTDGYTGMRRAPGCWKRETLFFSGTIFRFGILFPTRVLLLVFSIAWGFLGGVYVGTVKPSESVRLYIGRTFGRLFASAEGLVATFHNRELKPQRGGIAVSNHLTSNDPMTLFSDCEDGVSYTVTGQAHGGLQGVMQTLGGALTPALWMDRASIKERKAFQEAMVSYASSPKNMPVLLFPEGFCCNGDVVLQFRKGAFVSGMPIYPIAIKQRVMMGDLFWKEDNYLPYMLRVMASWCTQADVYYLPAMRMQDNENEEAFAKRAQLAIARQLGRSAIPYDGGMSRAGNQERARAAIARHLATVVA